MRRFFESIASGFRSLSLNPRGRPLTRDDELELARQAEEERGYGLSAEQRRHRFLTARAVKRGLDAENEAAFGKLVRNPFPDDDWEFDPDDPAWKGRPGLYFVGEAGPEILLPLRADDDEEWKP